MSHTAKQRCTAILELDHGQPVRCPKKAVVKGGACRNCEKIPTAIRVIEIPDP